MAEAPPDAGRHDTPPLPEREPSALGDRSRHRFTVAVVVALGAVSLPYLWILWDLWTSTADAFRSVAPANFYDLQARAMLAGHLYVPNGSLGIEAFVHGGHQYTYFGLFPSLLRMPVLVLTHQFDGRLTAPSLLLAWLVTGLFASLLLWRVRVLARGDAALGLAEAVCSGVLVAAVTGGSVLLYLAASPKVTHEDVAWSVALAIPTVFALLGVLERPSTGRVAASGVLVLATALNRSTTGYACIIGALLVAGWFAFSKGEAAHRRWAAPMAGVGLVALAVTCLVNWAKLGMPLGLSEADQVWTHVNAHRHYYLASNGGNAFGLKFLPTTLLAYLEPAGLHVSTVFPFLSLPTSPAHAVGNVVLDETYPTASLPASMPLAFLLGCWGLIAAFRPRSIGRIGLARLLLVATAAGTAGVLFFGYIADRYLADFLPFLALAAMVGLVDLWRRLEGRSHRVRVGAVSVIVVLGIFGVWANVGAALTPTALWTSAQAKQFLSTQASLGAAPTVEHGPVLPYFAPAGTVFVAGACQALYVSTGFSYSTIPGQQLQHETWIAAEQGPGINHEFTLEFNRPVAAGDAPIHLLSFGATSLAAVPTGDGQVRLEVLHPRTPSIDWPTSSTGPLPVRPGVLYRIAVTTDPYLHAIDVSGLGGGIEYYLAGSGPAVVATGSDPAATVTSPTSPTPSMGLCRTLLRHAPA
jgi:hypothetical protein